MAKTACILILLLSSVLSGQGTYGYERTASLSGAASVVTIHLLTGASHTVRFQGATVYCSVACTFTLEFNGSAPTGTLAGTTPDLGGTARTPQAKAYHTSDSSGGVTIKTYTVAASTETSIDLSFIGLKATNNLTIRTSSITGTARTYFQWRE